MYSSSCGHSLGKLFTFFASIFFAAVSQAQSNWDEARWDIGVWDEEVVVHLVSPSAGIGGDIYPANAVSVGDGEVATFTINTDQNYKIGSVGGTCDGTLADNIFSTLPVFADCTVEVSFDQLPPNFYSISVMTSEGGTLIPSSTVLVQEGLTTSFTVAVEQNYELVSLTGSCIGSLRDNLLVTIPIFEDCELNASFALISGTVPPAAPSIELTSLSSRAFSLDIKPNFEGSDPIDYFEAECIAPEIRDSLSSEPAGVFSVGDVSIRAAKDAGVPSTTFGSYPFDTSSRIHKAQVGHKFTFPATGGGLITVPIQSRKATRGGNLYFRGESQEGFHFNLLTTSSGVVFGKYFDGISTFELRPDRSGHRLYVENEGAIAPLNDLLLDDKSLLEHAMKSSLFSQKSTSDRSAEKALDSAFSVVSVLYLVDQIIAEEGYGTAAADYFTQVANTAFLESGVELVLNPVGVETYQPQGNPQVMSEALNDLVCGRLDCSEGEFSPNNTVDNLRKEYSADVIVQLVGAGYDACGVAYIASSQSPAALRYINSISVNAVSDSRTGNICSSRVVAHEIGHNMSLLHDHAQHDPDKQPYLQGGRGYVMSDGRVTVMAYGSSDTFRFSDPTQLLDGVRLGTDEEPYPANAVSVLDQVRENYAGIFINSNSELIPDAPQIVSATQFERTIDVSFDRVAPPVGTPTTGSTGGLKRLAYLASCGDKSEIGFSSPIRVAGLETARSYDCAVYAFTDYAVSDPSAVISVDMSPLQRAVSASKIGRGNISPSGTIEVIENEQITFELTPEAGYRIARVEGSCGGDLESSEYTTNPVLEDCTVRAIFEALPSYVVTPIASEGGEISPSERQAVTQGATTTFEITPNAGYFLSGVGGSCAGNLVGATFETSPITGDCTVRAQFLPIPPAEYSVQITVIGEGEVDPQTMGEVEEGATFQLELYPSLGWRLQSVDGTCGGSVSDLTYTSDPMTATCSVEVQFAKIPVTVSTSAGLGGEISPEGPITFDYGDSAQFDVSANSGYRIDKIQDSCGGRLVDSAVLIESVVSDCQIDASFVALPVEQFTVTGHVSNGGFVSPSLPVSLGMNEVLSLEISPDPGYRIASARGCGGELSGTTFTTSPISENCTIFIDFVQFRWIAKTTLNTVVFENLPPETAFVCEVSATSKAGTSSKSSSLTFSTMAVDVDSDGVLNELDNCPVDFNPAQEDFDDDGLGDICDSDDDNDGVLDDADEYPFDPDESADADGDGVGNNADTDDDGDGVPDSEDDLPLDSSETLDTDSDGIGNNADTDDDGDGFTDEEELAEGTNPLDARSYPDLSGLNLILIKAAIDAANAPNP